MNIIARTGRDDLAWLNAARLDDGSLIEFVESVQPPIPREEKWVLIISTLKGCPIGCRFCDAGGNYSGRLSAAQIFAQIDDLVTRRFPDRRIPIPKFKIQFARMGEPTLNEAVLEVLEKLPGRYDAPGLMPCLSSMLPRGGEGFFQRLTEIKNRLYRGGRFQLQFSLHTTDEAKRADLIGGKGLSFRQAARIGERFHRRGDRKIALNFAATEGYPIEPRRIRDIFNPEIYLIKLTPLNPTERGRTARFRTRIDPCTGQGSKEIVQEFENAGYEVILSLGEPDEDRIGTNCGQFVGRLRERMQRMTV
jgi:23S rRNA (adenine2503-C2)-methyltransferase